ncbi:MMPL family transporter, partial [Actinoplanes philippinensis]|uniref:MMPL family transporter n=1 Tax=Actinoplanes philippinensis TaxID=35752 RepID=UPI0033F1FE33
MLIVALVAVIGSGIWGFGVFGQLTEGGYNDPRSESARAAEMAAAATGGQGGDVIAIYTPDQGAIDDAALTKRIKDRLAALPTTAVESQSSYWDKKADAYASKDKKSAVAVITLAGEDDAAKMDAYADIEDALTVPGTHVQLAGGIPLGHASSQRSTDDLAFAEMVSLPIVLVLLLLIFGSLVAASLPVLVGGAAVLGSLGVLHAIALAHEVNSFAVNVASLLGLGMAIDYGLFMVGRFREEQALHSTADAVRRTVATAGRTVVFSATLLMTALAGLLLFPQGFLKSLAYGGLAAVFLAMLLSLTLLPAMLAVLGPRVDLIPIRLPGRRATSTGGWEKLAGWVLRRPVLVAVPIFAALVVLALPIADARFGENDERQLPAGDPSRVAIETLKTDYPQFASDGVQLVVHATGGAKPDVKAFTEAAAKVAGIERITTTGGNNTDTVILTADLKAADAYSDEARDAVDGLRALPPPAGAELLIGGATARNVDSLEAIGAELPLMIGLLAGATLVLMFLAFGSILLPVKAVVMSALSLTATFGSLVWIFQEGHGASWLDVTPTPLEAGIVVLMAAVVFGLSTDYEVFLLSRMVEARLRGATTREAVTIGLSRTGRVISAAALLLIVVTGAFALSSVTTMRFIGVGMIIALVLDATVVRVLLVPAVLAGLGDASWWAPGPLRRLQEKAGLAEYAGEEEATGRHAWRPLDPSLEETTVLDGTLLARALPAAPTEAALPAGCETSNTVVLDYEAVLDYLSEKNLSAGTPSNDPILQETPSAQGSPDEPLGPGRHRDALTSAASPASDAVVSPSEGAALSDASDSEASLSEAPVLSGSAPSATGSDDVSSAAAPSSPAAAGDVPSAVDPSSPAAVAPSSPAAVAPSSPAAVAPSSPAAVAPSSPAAVAPASTAAHD